MPAATSTATSPPLPSTCRPGASSSPIRRAPSSPPPSPPATLTGWHRCCCSAFPPIPTRRRRGDLGLLAGLTVDDSPAARRLCETICRFRPLAVALAPWVVRDLPLSVAIDGMRHTWASYSRTLRRVVIEHRAADDLLRTPMPVALLHGRDDRAAPLRFVQALAEHAVGGHGVVRLRVVDGDHHLAVRRPDLVADALAAELDGGTRR